MGSSHSVGLAAERVRQLAGGVGLPAPSGPKSVALSKGAADATTDVGAYGVSNETTAASFASRVEYYVVAGCCWQHLVMIKQLGKRTDIGLLRLLAQDSALAGVSEFLTRAFLFGINVLVSQMLADRGEYGVFAAVSWLAATVFAFTSIGVATTGVRAIAAARQDAQASGRVLRTVVLMISALALVAGAAVLAAAPWLVSVLEAPVPVDSVRLAALLVVLLVVLSGVEAAVRGLGRFRTLAWSAVIAIGVSLVPAYYLVDAYGVHGGIWALVLCYGLQAGILFAALSDQFDSRALMPWSEMRRFVGELAVPQWLSGAGFALGMMVPPMLLLRHSNGLESIGAWNASAQLRILVTFLPSVIAAAAVPHLTGLFQAGRLTLRTMGSYLGTVVLVIVLPWLVTVVLATEMLGLYGPSFRADSHLLIMVVSFTAVQVLGNGCSSILLAAGRVWAPAIIQVVWTVLILSVAPEAIREGGAYGLADIYLYFAVPVTVFTAWWSWRVRQPVVPQSAS